MKNVYIAKADSHKDAAGSSGRAKKWNRVMFLLGFITLLVSAFLSFKGVQSSNQSSVVLEKLVREQNEMILKQNKIQEEMLKVFSNKLVNEEQIKIQLNNLKKLRD